MPTYVTTPIYYVNALPHLGHAYTTIVSDVYSRFQRLNGNVVRFQTGTDEHGEKIAEAAAKAGQSPKAYVDGIAAAFQQTWPLLAVEPDALIRTTDAVHIKTVQDILQAVYTRGDIYFSEYSGLYCKGCERFLTDKELVEGKCPDHLVEPQLIAEQNYFFRMSAYQDWLIDHINKNPDFISPERYRNEVLSFLDEPLEDLCISRPVSRLTWGIPLPFDDQFVTYVWFDALINYITGLGYPHDPLFATYWPGTEHVIAKDILKPHAIYWPTMLRSLGIAPYKRLHVHGYWNVEDTKMSKSLGNVIRPADLTKIYGVDTLRYFLLREMSFGLDSSFSNEAIINRHNADLANDLGNLFSRSFTMIAKYCQEGQALKVAALADEAADHELRQAIEAMLIEYRREMEAFCFHKALQAVWELINLLNRYIVNQAPWELAKDATQRPRLQAVLAQLGGALWMLALMLGPIMPTSARTMAEALGMGPAFAQGRLDMVGDWARAPAIRLMQAEAPHLFPRVEKVKRPEPASQTQQANTKTTKQSKAAAPDSISIEQFRSIDLRVAEIIAAEPVANSERLLYLTVRAPEERRIVSGLALFYRPEELIGQKVVIVANLKPAKRMGLLSQGMVLTAATSGEDGVERLKALSVDAGISAGTPIA